MTDWIEVGDGGGDGDKKWWNNEGTITGKYVSKQTNVGQYHSNVYNLETEQGLLGVTGTAVLDARFEQIPVGAMVRIESLGKPQGKNYYNYKISMQPPANAQAPTTDEEIKDLFGKSE